MRTFREWVAGCSSALNEGVEDARLMLHDIWHGSYQNRVPNSNLRMVAADSLDEIDRPGEAALLRSPHHIYVRHGRVYRQPPRRGPRPGERFRDPDAGDFYDEYQRSAVEYARTHGYPRIKTPYYGGDWDPDIIRDMMADAHHFMATFGEHIPPDLVEDAARLFYDHRNGSEGGGFDNWSTAVTGIPQPILDQMKAASVAAGPHRLRMNRKGRVSEVRAGDQEHWGQTPGLQEDGTA